MSIEELEAEVLKLGPEGRARLAELLLESLENLTDAENARIWTQEAERRAADWEKSGDPGRDGADVFRDARSRLSK